MSLGPESFHHELENEIEKRIHHESPSKYDIDFYQRKVTRLENDLNDVQDQLSRARVRLRRAEDFQIKYELILKQNSTLISDNDKKQKQHCDLKAQYEMVKAQLSQRHSKTQDFTSEKQNLLKEVQKWKNRYEQSEEQRKGEIVKNEENLDKKSKREIDLARRQFEEREERYQEQIRQYRKQLHEKQTVQNIVASKVERIRQEKDEQIRRLNKQIESKKQEFQLSIKEKNNEIEKLREKFEQVFNFEIQNLRKTIDDQDEVFSIEINGLRELLNLKNDEIYKLLSEIKAQSSAHDTERDEQNQEINNLRQKIYQIQRQNEIQLYNVKERLSKIHSLQIDALEKRYSDLINNLKNERVELQKILGQNQKIMEAERADIERIKEQLQEKMKQKEQRITQLLERIKQSGDMNQTEMKTLHESFHQIETEKQNLTHQYQNNVGFLQQQIAKLTNNNELKTREVRSLHEEIARLKKVHMEVVKDLQERWKEERKQRQLEKERQREKRQNMQEEFRLKERDWKHKERDLEREKQREEREKHKFQYMVEQLEKDIDRLNKYNKELDDALKQQFKKNQMSTLDAGGVRRQLNSELQKQKSELEAIKRMQVDQISQKFEMELAKVKALKQKFETDLLKKEIAYSELEGEFKKLEHINKNIQKMNKEKMVEYQRKMATLNNEINLTQNLYQAFMKSKARSHLGDSP